MKILITFGVLLFLGLSKLDLYITPKIVIVYAICIVAWLLINQKNI